MNNKYSEKNTAFLSLNRDTKKKILIDMLIDIRDIDNFFEDQYNLLKSIDEPTDSILDSIYLNISYGLERLDLIENQTLKNKFLETQKYIESLHQKEALEKEKENVESMLEDL